MNIKEYCIRTLVAGRYRKVARYPRALPCDSEVVRAEKKAPTRAAQRFLNIATCTEQLMWKLVCNFDCKSAAFVTFDYSNEHIPDSRQAVQRDVRDTLRQLRTDYRKRGLDCPYIYIVEGQPGEHHPQANSAWEVTPWRDARRWAALDPASELPLGEKTVRLHAHAFLILPASDTQGLLRSFWPHGYVYINYIRVNDFTSFQRLALYCTKEARNGTLPSSAKSYIPCKGLAKPEINSRWAEAEEEITIPSSIPQHDRLWDSHDTDYLTGRQCHQIAYRFPRPNIAAPKPYQSKGKISARQKSAKNK